MKSFRKNEDGATLIFVGVCLAVLMGFAALTFDLGRMAATQSDMQGFADHVALAAAGELDGKADARDRARAAAAQLIQDRQTFGDAGGSALGGADDYTLRFLKSLPATDRAYFDPTDDLNESQYLALNDFEATMVEVTTRTTSVFLPFYRAFGALSGNDVGDGRGIVFARAVAGYTQYACDIATLMFCLPPSTTSLDRGMSMRLRSGGNNEPWGPGNFGFLDPAEDALDPNGKCATLSGSARYQCLIASSGNRTRCFAQRGVDMNTGQAVGIENAVYNTRFDIYNSTMSNEKSNSTFAPSLHRVTGYVASNGGGNDNGNGDGNGGGNDNGNGGGNDNAGGGQCLGNQVAESENSLAFQPDPCHAGGDCGAFGTTQWTPEAYVAKNYAWKENPFPILADFQGQDEFGKDKVFANLPANPTRFDVYLAEHEAAVKASNESEFSNGLPESNHDHSFDTCATVDPSLNPNRRVFIVAGIDCAAHNINGARTDVPVEEYYEVFLMGPVGMENGGSGNFDMHVEMIGPTGGDGSGSADDGGIFRVVVELLR